MLCMETPSRPACSRSTSTFTRGPPSCASEATSRSAGSPRSLRASLSAHSSTSAASLPTSVYWYCARLERVEIWMSWVAWKYTFMPGMPATASFSRAMIASTRALRALRGFKVMASRPALGVALSGLTPITDTTPVTSASVRMMASTSFWRRCISLNETSVPASVTAVIRPVSCNGRKPLGMTM